MEKKYIHNMTYKNLTHVKIPLTTHIETFFSPDVVIAAFNRGDII